MFTPAFPLLRCEVGSPFIQVHFLSVFRVIHQSPAPVHGLDAPPVLIPAPRVRIGLLQPTKSLFAVCERHPSSICEAGNRGVDPPGFPRHSEERNPDDSDVIGLPPNGRMQDRGKELSVASHRAALVPVCYPGEDRLSTDMLTPSSALPAKPRPHHPRRSRSPNLPPRHDQCPSLGERQPGHQTHSFGGSGIIPGGGSPPSVHASPSAAQRPRTAAISSRVCGRHKCKQFGCTFTFRPSVTWSCITISSSRKHRRLTWSISAHVGGRSFRDTLT